jgi:GNAT superfamily N-acetyltransferase
LISAVTGHEKSVPVDTLCIMAAAVKAAHQGTGLAGNVLAALRARAAAAGLRHVIAPVRPALKSRYPLTPMENFARWTREDGLHIDPWIRTHQRLGATILTPAQPSMIITGTVAEWEQWTGMTFPESSQYVVPDALDLVDISREKDRGTYAETNLWMRHL